jgi:hypothetical protein
MASNRAKGYCVSFLLCFNNHLYSFCQQLLPEAVCLLCDSKSLLDKTHTYLQHPRYSPNTSLQSDWGVVQQIASTILLFPHHLHLVHVKAHQDDAATFDNLGVESQLNVCADTLAKAYNSTSNHKASTVPPLPCNGASPTPLLRTNKYITLLPHRLTRGPYSGYTRIVKRNQWMQANMDMIQHWEGHSQALNKNFLLRHTFLVKFIPDKLSAGKMIARYNKDTFDHRCPSCRDEYKD